MKITDTLGRELHIDLVVQGPRGWMVPLGYHIEGLPTWFARVPHGPFALRVMSKDGAELKGWFNGQLILDAVVPGGIQFLEASGDGQPFVFAARDESTPDTCTAIDGTFQAAAGESEDAQAPALAVPQGHGLLFIVARFAPDKGPAPHPPRIEYPFVFQMNAGEDHDRTMARNLRRVVEPESPPNPDDLTSREAPSQPQLRINCLTCGKVH
jgi:hypothetical protein